MPGLALRISPSGRKTWTIRYRNKDGDQRRLSLGTYPGVGLARARELATQAMGDVAGGGDPALAKRAGRAAAKARKLSTVAGLVEAYFEDAATGRHRPNARAKRPGSMKLERYFYVRFVRPRFGALPVEDLTRHDVQRFLDEIGRDAPANARHSRNVIRQAFNYGIRREIVVKNPAQFSDLPAAGSRERVLSDDELRAIWSTTGDPATFPGLPGTALALRFALVTLQRGGEVVGLHASEIDRQGRLWTIPGARTKNHRIHVVPLSDAALAILADAFTANGGSERDWSGFAFPSPRPRSPAPQPMTRSAFTRAMARLRAEAGLTDATPHDFRRTGSTNITGERIGMSRFIVSQVLNQISDTGGAAAVTRVYDRNAYLAEKRKALDAWAALLAEIVSGETRAANVVSISEAAG